MALMDSLLRQGNALRIFFILNSSKILLKFAIVFKIFEYFCSFLSLTTITGQRNLQMGYLTERSRQKCV